MKLQVNQSEIELVQGDITESDTDAIVNAANSQLILGAGVAGAIRTKGGPSIQEECNAIGHCPVGGAVITSGGNLNARHVIHAVGPRQGEGDEEEKLKNATLNSLKVADQNHLKSITFPAISTGIYGFPIDACARIMLTTTKEYLTGTTKIERIVFALFDEKSFNAFNERANKLK
jgi:O-acetyl-ADP-ribose deacetylase (regulator of RNase III)